jgi:hypothetical protein
MVHIVLARSLSDLGGEEEETIRTEKERGERNKINKKLISDAGGISTLE